VAVSDVNKPILQNRKRTVCSETIDKCHPGNQLISRWKYYKKLYVVKTTVS